MVDCYPNKAMISYGNTNITVYKETAQIINGIAIATVLVVSTLIIAKLTA